jgi:hypothetical protein
MVRDLLDSRELSTCRLCEASSIATWLSMRAASRRRGGSGPPLILCTVLREPRRAKASSGCYRSFLTRELSASLLGRYGPDALDVPALTVMGENSPIRHVLNPHRASICASR